MTKRIFSLLTALALCLTLVPTAVFAETVEAPEPVPVCVCQTRCGEAQINEACPACGGTAAQPERCAAADADAPDADAPAEGDIDDPADDDEQPVDDAQQPDDTQQPEEDAEQSPEDAQQPPEGDETDMDETSVTNYGISVQAAGGELWLGGVNVLDNPTGNGPNGGSYHFENGTLTLTDYVAEGTNYHSFSGRSVPTAAYLYTSLQALKIELVGNCRFGDSENIEYVTGSKTIRTAGIVSDPNTNEYLYINSTDGKGNLEINSHIRPLDVRNVTLGAGTITLNSGMDGCSIRGAMTVKGSADVTMASLLESKLAYSGASITGSLTVYQNSKVTVTSNGVTYNSKIPKALDVGNGVTVKDNGHLSVTSSGSNSNDGCQGYGLYVDGDLKIQDNGRVEAYSNGYNSSTREHDGNDAIYITGTLSMEASTYLHAETKNPTTDNDHFAANGALRAKSWDLVAKDKATGALTNNRAVITYPAGGTIREADRCIYGSNAYSAKNVTIQGIRNATLALNVNDAGDKVWRYRGKDDSSDTTPGRYRYTSNPANAKLDLQLGYDNYIGPADHKGFSGIDVQKGTHTIVLNAIVQERDRPYITVRSGATLNLELTAKSQSYLANSSGGYAIKVESGATLNITGDAGNYLQTALTLIGGIQAQNGASVNFKNCIVYAEGYIGSEDMTVSVENCWISATGFVGNLKVKNSTVKGYHEGGTLTIDRQSNANLQVSSSTVAKDFSGTSVYRTQIELEDFSDSSNKEAVLYRQTMAGDAALSLFSKVTGLRLKYSGTTAGQKLENLSMLVGSDNILVLWLPLNTTTENVYGFESDSESVVSFIHDQGEYDPIVTKFGHENRGKLALRNLLLGKGILALRGKDALCAGYEEGGSNEWIYYEETKDVKLQSSKKVTGFGLRALTDADAEVKLNGLDLIGDNKRVTVDDRAELSMVLMQETENSMTSSGTDAVLNLNGSGSLTITGQVGGEKLTLGGHHAIDGSPSASLTIKKSTVINNCANKPETTLGKLTINNSTVTGLGTINCDNIIINGGSVDLDVPEGKTVKNGNGDTLTKTTLTISGEANKEVDKITFQPSDTQFNDDHIITDRNGKIFIWAPEGVTVETVVIGGKTYYPKADGSTTTGEKPEFTTPTADSSKICPVGNYFKLSAAATGTPAPTLQWQISTDNGATWTDIEGATNASYQEIMTLDLHNALFRCVAKNTAGEAVSKTFQTYYLPNNASVQLLPQRGKLGDCFLGDTMTAKATLDGTQGFDTLSGVTASYQWVVADEYIPVDDERWNDIASSGDASYSIANVTKEMDYSFVRCRVTLTYPNQEVEHTLGGQRLYVYRTPVITEHPQDLSVEATQQATFSVELSDDAPFNGLTCLWQISRDGGTTWTDIEGSRQSPTYDRKDSFYNYTISYTTPAATAELNGCLYRYVAWDHNGNIYTGDDHIISDLVYSDAATLTVTGLPQITAQPKDAAVTYGTDVTFRVAATVDTGTLHYQWQVKTTPNGTFTDIDGATGTSYTLSAPTVDMSGHQYRCVVSKTSNGVYEFSAAAALTVTPKTLTRGDLTYTGPITRAYDGGVSAPGGFAVSVKPAALVGSDTLPITGSAVYNSANVSEANTITFTPNTVTTGNYRLAETEVLTITGASITKAEPQYTTPAGLTAQYGQTLSDVSLSGHTGWSWTNSGESVGDAAAGAKTFPARFTPADTANYQTLENLPVPVTVGKADGGSLGTIALTQQYTDTADQLYTPSWAGLPAGQTWSYNSESSITLPKQDIAANGSSLTYAIPDGKAIGDTFTITLKASCNNYEDFTITLTITLTKEANQTALKLTGGTTVVYGQKLTLRTSGGSGTGTVTYTVTNGTGEATIDANGVLTPVKVGTVTVTATKAGDADYSPVTAAPVEITITKATPTGEPGYTKINGRGRTLADAKLTLTGSSLTPGTGALKWVDENGNVLSDTTVVKANTAYTWRFTPADSNYTPLTGSVVLYAVSPGGGFRPAHSNRGDRHTITAIAGANGAISPSGNSTVPPGGDQTFTITPDKGYAIAKVLIDGKSVGAVTSYTFRDITEDHTIRVIFMKANGNPQTGVLVP